MANNAILVPMKGRGGAAPEYGNTQAPVTAGSNASARLQGGAVQIANAYNLAHYKGEDGGFDWEMLDKAARAGQRLTGTVDNLYWTYQGAKAKDAFNRYLQAMQQKQAELSELKGEAALGKNGVQAQLREWASRNREALTKDLGNDAKVLFGRHADMEDSKMSAWARRVEFSEMNNYIDSVDEGRLHMLMETAQRDPSQITAGLGQARAVIDGMMQRKGLAKEYADAKFSDFSGKMFSSVLSNCYAVGDIAGAQAILSQHASSMSPEVQAKAYAAYAGAVIKRVRDQIDAEDYSGAEQTLQATRVTSRRISLPQTVDAKLIRTAQAEGVDPNLVRAIAMQESGGKQSVRSHAGAVGVMQIIPKYAKDFGGGDVVNSEDDNIRVGVREIKAYLKKYNGNIQYALMAYNWGPGNVDSWIKTGKGMKGQPVPQETRNYVPSVMAMMNGAGGGAGAKPSYRLSTEQGTAELQRVMAGLDKKKQAAWAKTASDDIYAATAGLSGERRLAQAVSLAEKTTSDTELQQMILKDVESRMKFDEVKRKAAMVPQLDEAAQIIESADYSLPEKRLLIQQSPLPDEVKQIAFKEIDTRINGDDNKAASAAGLTQLRALYDERRGNISEEEALSLAVDYGLNRKDRDAWMQYKGRADVYPQFRIQKLAESVDSSLKNNPAKVAELYDALMKRIPAGDATWDDKKIKAEMFNLLQAGKRPDAGWFGGGQTFGEAVRTGQTGTWRPTMDEATDKSYAVALENDHTPVADGFSASVGDVYTHASDDLKKLLRQQRYMRERFGVNISWTKEEQAMLAREVNKVQALKNKGAF